MAESLAGITNEEEHRFYRSEMTSLDSGHKYHGSESSSVSTLFV